MRYTSSLVSNLTVDEIGLYWVACSMMYARRQPHRQRPALDRPRGRLLVAKARSLIKSLLAKEKFSLDDPNQLTNHRVMETILAAQTRMKVARNGGETSSNRKRIGRENRAHSSRINGLGSTSQQPATSNQQPSSSERENARARATPSSDGCRRSFTWNADP